MTRTGSVSSLSTNRGQLRKLGKVNGLPNTSLFLPHLLSPPTECETPQPWGSPHLFLSPYTFLQQQDGVGKCRPVGPSLYFSFRQSTETVQSSWNVIWLKRAERMEEQKQLNPNCFSFHCPPENRGDAGREVSWILHSVPFFEVWTMDNFNCSYMMVFWGRVHARTHRRVGVFVL